MVCSAAIILKFKFKLWYIIIAAMLFCFYLCIAHPNVKLFISHGGLLGTTEAVYEGVPILSMPLFGDQITNIKSVVSKGAAEMMNYGDLNEEEILIKITSMLTNPM